MGLSFHQQGFCVGYPRAESDSGQETFPWQAEFFSARGAEAQIRLLQKVVSRKSLRSLPATIVMEPGSYRLLQVPAPKVHQNEVDSALRWQVRDLVDLDVENAIIRSYPMPGQGRPSSPLLFVVVAERDEVRRLVEMADDVGLRIRSVITVELALRQLLHAAGEREQPTLLLAMMQERTFLVHVVGGELYRARELDHGASHLPGSGSRVEDALWPDRLVDEVGRFAVFCGRHCEQGAAQRLLVPSPVFDNATLSQQLSESLGIRAELISPCPVDPHCLPALGAACGSVEGG